MKKSILINKELWAELNIIKYKLGVKNLSQVIKILINLYKNTYNNIDKVNYL